MSAASTTLSNFPLGSILQPGESTTVYGSGKTVGFSNDDLVIVQATPTDEGQSVEITQQWRRYGEVDTSEPAVFFTVKNTGDKAVKPNVLYMVCSSS